MRKRYIIFIFICFYIILVDQWTKYAIQQRLPLYTRVEVIKGFFNLTHVRNKGGAFGIFGGEKLGFDSIFFIVISLIAIGSLFYIYIKVKSENEIIFFPFSLIIGGAIGNLIDRIRLGEVIDFLDFIIFYFHWPAFNIADSAISLGVILLGYGLLFRSPSQQRKT